MNKLKKLAAVITALASTLPVSAFAQDGYVSSSLSDNAQQNSVGATGAFLLFFIVLYGIFIIIGMVLFVFWIFMLVDVFKRTNWKQENDKTLWILLVILLYPIGSILYFFLVKRKLDNNKNTPTAPPSAT